VRKYFYRIAVVDTADKSSQKFKASKPSPGGGRRQIRSDRGRLGEGLVLNQSPRAKDGYEVVALCPEGYLLQGVPSLTSINP
ncbi:hypothetical protein ACC763_40800, partial [Rhizobium ruizarguesonis]